MAERAEDKDVMPLCPSHHRTGQGGVFSIHLHQPQFHKLYGSDEKLTKITRIGVQKMLDDTIGKRA